MRNFIIICIFINLAIQTYPQTLVGIKKVIIVKNVSDDLKTLDIAPSTNYIKDQIRNDITDIDIVSAIDINVFENASIAIYYNIYKNYKTTIDEQYYGSIELKVSRDILDSRFNTPLLSVDVYSDAVYLLVNNPDLYVFKNDLIEQTNKLIRNLAYYLYYQNSNK